MNEAIRNAALFLWAFCAVNSEAYAAEPSTIIYGASETAPGVHDSAVVRFRDDEGNIMGQPIDVGGFESAADNGQPPAVLPWKPFLQVRKDRRRYRKRCRKIRR